MFNVRVASNHLYGKWLFTWLSLVMSLMMSYFVLSFSHEMSWMRSGTELSRFLRILQFCKAIYHSTDAIHFTVLQN